MPARLARLGVVLMLLAGCAKKGPPTGGPPDIEPPRLIGSSPDSGTAGIPRTAVLSLAFSEGMEPRSTGDAISIVPPVELRQRRWSGNTVMLVPQDSLEVDRTYTVFLGSGARDRHGNPLAGAPTIVFTTADSLSPGTIEGRLEGRGFAAPGTYLWGYRAGRDPDSTARDFDAIGIADANGVFRLVGLPVPGRYRLWVFADLNGNRSFEPDDDILAPTDTTFDLAAGHVAARGFVVTVLNPRAPGRVRGAVLDSLRIEGGSLAVVAVATNDSLHFIPGIVDDRNGFDLQLPAGGWKLRAWRDLDRNRSWEPEREPASDPHPVEVTAATDVVGVTLVLRRPGPR
jgi:hypothetical protein